MTKEKSGSPRYPWAELYNIESGVKKAQISTMSTGPGRPPSIVKRHKTSITLMDEEKRLYEKLAYVLGSKLHPNTITKSQVMGLALRYLNEKVENLPESLKDWEQLAEYLFDQDVSSAE
jgi:hypothetical protein